MEINPEGEAYLLERRRVTGKFMEQLELWDFPFDVQVNPHDVIILTSYQ